MNFKRMVTMKQINHNAPVLCEKSIVIQATPETIWKVLTDINHWPDWMKNVSKAKLNGPLQPATTFDWKAGGAKIHSTLHTVEPYALIGWTGNTMGIHAVHNWVFEAAEGGTKVEVSESMEGLLARLFKGTFNKMLAKDMVLSLDWLKTTCEAGK